MREREGEKGLWPGVEKERREVYIEDEDEESGPGLWGVEGGVYLVVSKSTTKQKNCKWMAFIVNILTWESKFWGIFVFH